MVLQKSLIVGFALSLTACSTTFWYTPTPHQVDFQDLNYFKWDCPHAPEQMAFLRQQLAMTSPFPGDAPRRAIIYKNMNEMKMYCGQQLAKPAGCTHVREDMTSGSAQATVCNANGRLGPAERPVVNRWDPLVDTK
jgi:hypothetical protein